MINSPVIIVGCARSGTTLLYNVLAEAQALWSIGDESKSIIERYHHPSAKGWESGELSAGDLTPISRAYLTTAFTMQAAPGSFWRRVNGLRRAANGSRVYASVKRRGRGDGPGSGASSALPAGGLAAVRALVRLRNRLAPPAGPIRLLEKTPENCLRLPFLTALWPDARIIFLTRDSRANVHSLMEGWRQPHLFPGYRTPLAVTGGGQTRGRWAFTLIPGWRDLVDRPLEEICAKQWATCNAAVLDYAATPGSRPVLTVRYEGLVAEPEATLARIALFLELAPEDIPAYGQKLPEVNVVSRPDADKWRVEAMAIGRVEGILSPVMKRLGYESANQISPDPNTAS